MARTAPTSTFVPPLVGAGVYGGAYLHIQIDRRPRRGYVAAPMSTANLRLALLQLPANPSGADGLDLAEQAIRRASWPDTTLVAWPFPVSAPMAQRQIGVDPLSRGPGWMAFARSFERRWGYRPGPVEGAGYDTGLMAALASVSAKGQPGWGLDWFSANAKPHPLCRALKLRSQGSAVRPMGASSRLDLSPGVPPTANLQLSRR